jgi:glutamate--cysteine ligase
MHLTESAAELMVIRRSFVPAMPGLVGARIGLAARVGLADGRHRLRHGHLEVRGGRATLSVPPSPGLDVAIRRALDDLALVERRAAADPAGWLPGAAAGLGGPVSGGPSGRAAADFAGTSGTLIALEAGTAGRGLLSYRHRWTLAHTLGPVLHAVFGAPGTGVPPAPGPEPRTAWCATALDAVRADGRTFREWIRGAERPTQADLDAHLEALALPVRARGHLEIEIAGPLAGDRWIAALAVTAALFADRAAIAEATAASAVIHRPDAVSPWIRAARDGLNDPDLAAAAHSCLFAGYDALARQGAGRAVRQAVATVIETAGRPSRAFPL